MFFRDLLSLVIAEKMKLVWAKETEMLAVLWSTGPIRLQRERVFLAARAALLSMRASDHFVPRP